MKSVIALLFASASAIKMSDAPAYFNKPTWNEKFPSASGFVQVSACEAANVDGVTCDQMLFATGMNGDEDLKQTIKMKGDTYKYAQNLAQWTSLDVATAAGALPICTGTNGPVSVNCKREACTGTNGPMDGPAASGCDRAEPAAIPHYNTDPEAGRAYQTSGDQTPTNQVPAPAPYVGQNSATFAQLVADDAEEKAPAAAKKSANRPGKTNDEIIPAVPEKVSTLESPLARSHTTFYGQRK